MWFYLALRQSVSYVGKYSPDVGTHLGDVLDEVLRMARTVPRVMGSYTSAVPVNEKTTEPVQARCDGLAEPYTELFFSLLFSKNYKNMEMAIHQVQMDCISQVFPLWGLFEPLVLLTFW